MSQLSVQPRKMKEEFDKWIITQPPWMNAVAAGLFGSFQVRINHHHAFRAYSC